MIIIFSDINKFWYNGTNLAFLHVWQERLYQPQTLLHFWCDKDLQVLLAVWLLQFQQLQGCGYEPELRWRGSYCIIRNTIYTANYSEILSVG